MKDYRNMSPDEIEQDIASTRAHIDRTLDVLTARLSPGGLVDQAVRTARDTGGEFTVNLGRTIRDNPVPTALLGLGVGWLMLAGRKSGGGGYFEPDEDDLEGEYGPARRYQVSSSGLAPTSTMETSDLDVPEDWGAAYDDQGEVDAEGRSAVREGVETAKAAGKEAYEQVREGADAARASVSDSARRGSETAREAARRAKYAARDVGGRVSDTGRRTSERARGMAQGLSDRAGATAAEVAHGLSDRASATAERARLYGSSVADRASDAYRRGGYAARQATSRARETAGSAGSFAREHPIAVGLGILALGAAIAAFLPRTRREDELLGEKADELKAAAREQAEVQAERARDAAAAAIEAGKQQAREAGLTPENLKEKLSETAAAAAGVAKSAAEAGAEKAKEGSGKPVPGATDTADDAPTPATPTGGVAGVSGISPEPGFSPTTDETK